MTEYDIDPEFCQWYALYPVKKGKAAAFKSWRRIKNKPPIDTLLDVLQNQIDNESQWQRGYIPHPTTYLNQKRYEDEITQTRQTRTETVIDRAKQAIAQRSHAVTVDALAGTLW